MNALFLTTILPSKKQIGSEVASQWLIEGLRANNVEVDVVGYVRPDDRNPPASGEIAVQPRYIESRNAKLYPLLWLLQSLASRTAYTAAKYRSAQYRSFRTVYPCCGRRLACRGARPPASYNRTGSGADRRITLFVQSEARRRWQA